MTEKNTSTATENFAGHTPGPWNFRPDPASPEDQWEIQEHGDGTYIAVTCGGTHATKAAANARLIAAAPSLLAERDALKARVERLEKALSEIAEQDDDFSSAEYAANVARSALAEVQP